VSAALPSRAAIRCERMHVETRAAARALLAAFLDGDEHYRASAPAYGDGGLEALDRALDLFIANPSLGFVWLAFSREGERAVPVAACVVCFAISTSRGSLVAKLDDVHVAEGWQGQGVGTAMLRSLADSLRDDGATRIDCGCHRDNVPAWRFYQRLGFRPLDEERIACLL